MADNSNVPQNFENHARTDPKMVTASVLYLLALILTIVGLFTPIWVTKLAVFMLIVAATLTAYMARVYATTLQDRLIMLEMRLRLERVLDGELKGRIPELTRSQLIGLRFASDAELPELAHKTLDRKLTKAREVKKLVTDWQADYHRV